jgi:hypothetical protein
METSGAIRAYQSAFTDTDSSGSQVPYTMKIESGDLAVFDLGHQFRVAEATVHGEYVAALTLSAAFTANAGLPAAVTWPGQRVIAAAPFQTRFKPTGMGRVQAVRFSLTLPATGGGAVFSGMTLVVQDRGNKHPNNTQQATTTP